MISIMDFYRMGNKRKALYCNKIDFICVECKDVTKTY